MSVVRAGREIDYGWYFMGTKRKENYDDWWRCEICFNPDLDELFGVTHTKQRINPTEDLKNILTPDLERIARELNNEIRKRYLQLRGQLLAQTAAKTAENRDGLMEPLKHGKYKSPRSGLTGGYRIETKPLEDSSFYLPMLSGDRLSLVLNREHNFSSGSTSRFRSPIPYNLNTSLSMSSCCYWQLPELNVLCELKMTRMQPVASANTGATHLPPSLTDSKSTQLVEFTPNLSVLAEALRKRCASIQLELDRRGALSIDSIFLDQLRRLYLAP